jgi:hypothetical protein
MAEQQKIAADDQDAPGASNYINDIEDMYEENKVHTKLKQPQRGK